MLLDSMQYTLTLTLNQCKIQSNEEESRSKMKILICTDKQRRYLPLDCRSLASI